MLECLILKCTHDFCLNGVRSVVWLTGAELQAERPVEPALGGYEQERGSICHLWRSCPRNGNIFRQDSTEDGKTFGEK